MISMDRRQALQSIGLFSIGSLLAGCRMRPFCATEPAWHDKTLPLTIDTHAHVFNASDLQVSDFVTRVAAKQNHGGLANLVRFFGDLLQDFAWNTAPSVRSERDKLEQIRDEVAACPELEAAMNRVDAVQYSRTAEELRTAARATRARKSLQRSGDWQSASDLEKGLRAIEDLPQSSKDFKDQAASRAALDSLERKSIDSALEFFFEMCQFRYMSAYRLLNTYNSRARKLDLVLAHLVDYDWWLSGGARTRSSLQEQADLMADIAALTAGRVHYFAPFCPLRELLHRADPGRTFSSLDFVRKAVREQGAIGVKLYPPMGFAPYGNATLDPNYWRAADWLPSIAHEPGFGAKLDAVLFDLYSWCRAEEVPVMAHTNDSNGPLPEFQKLAGPDFWKLALAKCPPLRANFGHFGTVLGRNGSTPNAELFLQLMSRDGTQPGAHAFADSGYFSEVLEDAGMLEDGLVELLLRDHAANRMLPGRFMFGTDWKMLVLEKSAAKYLSDMDGVIQRVAARLAPQGDFSKFSAAFFGWNAVEWLGLRKGQQTRKRLDDFYARHRFEVSPWSQKVDDPAPA
jgi:hypothetical protein